MGPEIILFMGPFSCCRDKNPKTRITLHSLDPFERASELQPMKETDLLPTSALPAAAAAAAAAVKPDAHSLFGKGRYKFYALGAIILLAFWSMLTGSVTLNLSSAAGAHGLLSDDHASPLLRDLDVLEVEEREKVVRHMWEVYSGSQLRQPGDRRLPKFWQEAFEAAYEELASDDADVRDAAVAEIAQMSMRMVDLDPPGDYLSKNVARKNTMAMRAKSGAYSSRTVL